MPLLVLQTDIHNKVQIVKNLRQKRISLWLKIKIKMIKVKNNPFIRLKKAFIKSKRHTFGKLRPVEALRLRADGLSRSKGRNLEWEDASDVQRSIKEILKVIDLAHIRSSRIFCFRTNGSKSRAYARIWSYPKIFQRALGIEPAYVIEVLSKHFDKLDNDARKKVLIHELLHIPKNFSGALLPHNSHGRRLESLANKLFEEYKRLNHE